MLTYASTLRDIKKALDPRHLELEELSFFVETFQARDEILGRRAEIANYLESDAYVKLLVAGHAGTGKSTELVKFEEEHPEFVVANFSVVKEAQPNVGIEALLVLIVESVSRTVKNSDAQLNEAVLKDVYNWFSETFNYKEQDLKFAAAVGGEVDTGKTFLGKLLGFSAFAKADIKTGSHTLNQTITKENKRLSELAYQCFQVIKEAQIGLAQMEPKRELLLIIEDLDKIDLEPADRLFIENPAPLADLPCKAIFTAPIFLLYTPQAADLASRFQIVTIPMIKLYDKDNNKFDEGWAVIDTILSKRFDTGKLIEKDGLDMAIKKTGGVLRHLFNVLTTASMVADQAFAQGKREQEKIIAADVRYGLNRLKTELIRRVSAMGLPPEFKGLTTDDLYQRLKDFLEQPQTAKSDNINLVLLRSHALIEYNGEGWHRVHPLVAEEIERYG